MSREVVVLGAGVSGLVAAVELAAAGWAVTVLERGVRAGGKAGIVVVDGVETDTGPSVVTLPHVFDAVFRAAGSSLADEATLFQPAPATRYHYPDGLALDVFSGRERTVASVDAALGADAAAEVDAFLRYAAAIWEASAPHFVEADAPSVLGTLRLGPGVLLRDLPRIDAARTMHRAARARLSDPRLRWLFERFATYNGSDPRRAPATLHCIAHVELGLGVYGVEGGIHALVRALVRVAEGLGVRFRYGVEVVGLIADAHGVRGVATADGDVVAARHVVSNVDTALLRDRLLPPDLARPLRARHVASTSGWTAILKARRRPEEARPAHAVLFPTDYAQEFADLFDRDRGPVEPTVYVCAQEKAHRRAGWADHEPLFVMANAPAEPAHGPRPAEVHEALGQRTIARLRAAGLVEPDDAVVWQRSPAGLALDFPGSRGSLYGAASNDLFAAFRRPPNRVPGVRGLYLASGTAHPGGGLPLVALSGRAAARALLADAG
jgi:phytoene desaturase